MNTSANPDSNRADRDHPRIIREAVLFQKHRVNRRLAAVMAADVAGYTRLMELNENQTHARLMELRHTLIEPTIKTHGGRNVKNTGDGFIAIFPLLQGAARCAVQLQGELAARAVKFPIEHRILFRMAVNLCETIIELDDVYGEGVNLTARLQAYSEPGDLIIPAVLEEAVKGALHGLSTFDLGDLPLKHITKRVHAIGVRIGSQLLSPPMPVCLKDELRPSLAVLPFRWIGRKPSNDHSAESITEEITHALSSLRDLFVVSKHSASKYKHQSADIAAIGRELGVSYILHGSVSKSDGRIRIWAALYDAESDQLIRSERFEGSGTDLFELQTQVALSAVKSLAPDVLERELRRALRKHPESLTAYDLVLQAQECLYSMDYAAHCRARGLLQQAINLEPGYGPAYTYTAYWHVFRVGEGWSSDPTRDVEEASRMAAAAIGRDPRDAFALAIYGHVQSFLLRDYSTALEFLERAIECGPNCATAWAMNSATHGYIGDGYTAIRHAERGLRLSPLDPHIFWHQTILAQAYYVNGDHEVALAWARKAAAQNPTYRANLRLLAVILVALGRLDRANEVASRMLKAQPSFNLRSYAARCPFNGEALTRWLERLRQAGLPG